MAIVYLLTNIENGKRYVGKTKSTLQHRWDQHVRESTKGSTYAIHCAIRKYGADSFNKRVLGEYPTEEEALVAEREWIAKLGAMGPNGYNLTEGGRGAVGYKHTPEEIARRAERMKVVSADPDWLAKKSADGKAQWADPEIAAKNRAAIEIARAAPEVRAKMSAGAKARAGTPEARTRISRVMTDLWKDPEKREQIVASLRATKASSEYKARASDIAKSGVTEESKAAQSAVAKAQWADPAKRAEKIAGIKASRTPEMIAAISAHHKELFNTPEMKVKMSEVAQARVAASVEERAAMKARPCSKCGSPRVTLKNGTVRCNVCHADKERERQRAKRAMVRGMPESTETKPADEREDGAEPFVPAFCPDMTPDLPMPLFEADGSC